MPRLGRRAPEAKLGSKSSENLSSQSEGGQERSSGGTLITWAPQDIRALPAWEVGREGSVIRGLRGMAVRDREMAPTK